MKRPRTLSAALSLSLSFALFLAAAEARASFTYSVAANPTSVNFGLSTYTIAPAYPSPTTSPTLAGTQNINIAQTTQTSTQSPASTDTTSFLEMLVVTIKNLESGLSDVIIVKGTINVVRSDTLGAASTYTPSSILPPSLTLGGFVYTLTGPSYTAPTIQGGANANGGISILITEAAVPEPNSLALMGIGAAALTGLAFRRRLVRRDA